MKQSWKKFGLTLLFGAMVTMPVVLLAQTTGYTPQPIVVDPNSNFERNSGLGNANPGDITALIINWVLGLLALIALVLVVYAGFLWMLAAGNEDQVKKAKDILQGAFFGILIILASYGITQYVFENLVKATQ